MGVKNWRYRTKISWDFAPLPLATHALLQAEVQQKSSDLPAFLLFVASFVRSFKALRGDALSSRQKAR
jgi:hypothetical protein